MQRIFKVGPNFPKNCQWRGRCTVDSDRPDQYIHHANWPILSTYTLTFTTPLTRLMSEHYWEEIDPDLEVAEGL